MLAGFGPWRGWLLTADLYRRSRSVNTMHYTSVIGGDSATAAALTGEDGIPPPPVVGGGMTWLPVTPSPPPIFSLFCPVRGAPFRETRSVERNLLLASERCIGNAQRRAEPPTCHSSL